MGSQRGAHCGPRSPPRGTICSLSMHHLLVWAVAGATGGGGLRSECVSIPDAAAGAGQALIRHPSPGTRPLGGGGLRPPWRALPLASALWALQSPLAASTPGGGWSPEEQRAKRLALRTHPAIGEPRPPRLPGAAPGKSQAHRPQPPPGELLALPGHWGARRSAVLSSPQSLGNHNGVSISVRTSPAPATQITDNFHTSHLTFWSAARRQDRLGEAFHIKL